FFFQAEDGIRDFHVTGVQTCALPIFITNDTRLPNAINRYAHLVDGQIEVVDSPKDFAKDKKRSKKALPAFLKETPATTYDTVARSEERREGKSEDLDGGRVSKRKKQT